MIKEWVGGALAFTGTMSNVFGRLLFGGISLPLFSRFDVHSDSIWTLLNLHCSRRQADQSIELMNPVCIGGRVRDPYTHNFTSLLA